jgi:hypothetical protein
MNIGYTPFQRFLLGGMVLWCVATWSASAQSNIVVNGSFEEGALGWQMGAGSFCFHPSWGAPEGSNEIALGGELTQELNTVPGRDYLLQFAVRGSITPCVTWGDTIFDAFTNSAVVVYWREFYCYAHAVSNLTRLTFSLPASVTQVIMDDIRVGWLQEPISFRSQPSSLSGYEGSTVSFTADAQGGPPLCYQWKFNGTSIANGTNRSLVLSSLRTVQAGSYSVVVSNVAGSLTSSPAVLNVEPAATGPIIILQPESQTLAVGYGFSLRALALGASPLTYLWTMNGTNLSDATNSSVVFDSIQTNNAGTYTVLVSNHFGTSLSLPAVLSLTNATGGGGLLVTNNTPVRDVDGVTRLDGTNYLAQYYVGPTPDVLRPIGPRRSFKTGSWAGFLTGLGVTIPDVPPNGTVYVQLRAWEAAWGATYEEARGNGGKYGFSEIRACTARFPGPFAVIPGFNLRAGLPFFYTGRLASGGHQSDGSWQIILTGEPGFRYLIEKRSPPNDWSPWLVVTNVTGTVTFEETNPVQHPVHFYRSRILD